MAGAAQTPQPCFNDLDLPEHLLRALQALGYAEPTPIQAQAIPPLLAGHDVLGQAQTGTGKTAAFALPLLANINLKKLAPQVLVLTPTRELALQVSEAFNTFAIHMPELKILPVYGGQGFSTQLNALRKGVHIIIGTPGRVMDHLRRESLSLKALKTTILDEADEMLRMGFAEDVEWILQQIPSKQQTGLFSATMPKEIKAIAEKHLDNPTRITIKNKTTTASTVEQFYWPVSRMHKTDALIRVIETIDADGTIIFVNTKRQTEELAQSLSDQGFSAVAINGDIVQQQRERVIEQLRQGKVDILIATDVAARGIDVERVTHVINYDAPTNTESYVHRIGRTGRAGRSGTAIVFISPRERFLLRNIEFATKQKISELPTPSISAINEKRIQNFKQRITDAAKEKTSFFEKIIAEFIQESEMPAEKVAATLAKLLQGDKPLLLKKEITANFSKKNIKDSRDFNNGRRQGQGRDRRAPSPHKMEQYRVELGRKDGLLPRNLVGVIANTTGLEGHLIGKIKIEDKFSLVDLPKGMPANAMQGLQRLKFSGKPLKFKKIS